MLWLHVACSLALQYENEIHISAHQAEWPYRKPVAELSLQSVFVFEVRRQLQGSCIHAMQSVIEQVLPMLQRVFFRASTSVAT